MPPTPLPVARALSAGPGLMHLPALPLDVLLRYRQTARRLVEDDVVTVGRAEDGRAQHLQVDPLPFVLDATSWASLERGLAQRAELLDLLLADLYGDRTVVARGLLPPELVMGHPGFVPQADGIATRHGLFLTAADLGQDEDGEWRVVADRAQSPIGVGYAMAVRRITARTLAALHRETPLQRLRPFFDRMRTGLQEMAEGQTELPRIVMLTAAEPDESTFDEMFTATLLGFPVVTSEDLSLRSGRVWLQTTERPEPVDVIVRRVDAEHADSLDLPTGSGDGLPGLVEATRRGIVSVVNPIGAGVLENPALAAFLPQICRALLGEELLLPSATTWWCGDPAGREHVRRHLDELLVAPISPSTANPRIFAGELAGTDRDALWARIEAEPWAWCAAEVLPMWHASVVTDTGLVEHSGVLRTFTIHDAQGTQVMPGGLARLSAKDGERHAPRLRLALAKDVWVLSDDAPEARTPRPDGLGHERPDAVHDPERTPAGAVSVLPPLPAPAPAPVPTPVPVPAAVPLSASAAENLYWFGRYAERAESTARLLLVADDLVEDHLRRPGTTGFAAMQVLVGAIGSLTASQAEDPVAALRDLVVDADRRGTVRYCARRATAAAARVRELLSADTWLILSRLDRSLTRAARTNSDGLQTVLGATIESCLAVAGVGAEGLVRDASWAFHDAGRRVERAQEAVRLLRRTVAVPMPPSVARMVLEAVLRSRESVISHRRRTAEAHRAGQSPLAIALELLLTDPTNPRSVTFCLHQLRTDLALTQSGRAAGGIDTALDVLGEADPTSLAALADDLGALDGFLGRLEGALKDVSAELDSIRMHRAPARHIEEAR